MGTLDDVFWNAGGAAGCVKPMAGVDWHRGRGNNLPEGPFNLFLHQATITNAAFAVVPWLVDACKKRHAKLRTEYLIDTAIVEANRLKYGLHFNREGTEETPDWLMLEYRQSIVESLDHFDEVILDEPHEAQRLRLVDMKPALLGDASIAWP